MQSKDQKVKVGEIDQASEFEANLRRKVSLA